MLLKLEPDVLVGYAARNANVKVSRAYGVLCSGRKGPLVGEILIYCHAGVMVGLQAFKD